MVLALACISAAVAPAPVAPSSQVAVARKNTVVSGMAGDTALLTIDRPVAMNNAGFASDLTVSGGRWVGVLIARTEDSFAHFGTEWYVHYRLTDELLCPGANCPLPRFTDGVSGGTEGDGTILLAPGHYRVTLLGDRDERVTARLDFEDLPAGDLDIEAGAGAEMWVEFVEPELALNDEHHYVSRHVFDDGVPGPRFDGMAVAMVMPTPAAANFSHCFSVSGQPDDGSVDRCLGGGGAPEPVLLADVGPTTYGIGYALGTVSEPWYVRDGFDAEIVAESARLVAMRFTVTYPTDLVEFARLAGTDRIRTAVEVSRYAFVSGADTVVLARADTYPDALAGAPLAYQAGGPILLNGPDRLDPSVAEEIRRLGAEQVILLGGTSALSDNVVLDLRLEGVDRIDRIAGTTRWGTAAAIAREVDGSEAFVVAADHPDRGWPDALAAAAIAARHGAPILLVGADWIPDETLEALASIDHVVIVGGEGTISRAVENALRGRVSAVERIAGENRYATNLALLDRFLAEFPADGCLWVATGRGFPDALAAGPAVAATAGRLLLVDGGDPAGSPGSVAWFAQALKNQVVLVGGDSAISGAVEQRLQEGASTAS